MIPWDQIVEYGMGLVALAMMYSITFDHLKGLQTTLTDIKVVLARIEKALDTS